MSYLGVILNRRKCRRSKIIFVKQVLGLALIALKIVWEIVRIVRGL